MDYTYRHNSSFKVKPDAKRLRGRKRLDVGTVPMKRIGRRTKSWLAVWAWLKPRLEKAGRTSCEFDFLPHDCWGRLDPAHSKKRRDMKDLDIYAVGIACAQAHRILDEVMTHAQMEKAVWRAIRANGGVITPAQKAEAAVKPEVSEAEWNAVGCAVFVGRSDPRPVAVTNMAKAVQLLSPGLRADRSVRECEEIAAQVAKDHNEVAALRLDRDALLTVAKRASDDFDILILRGDLTEEPRAHQTLAILREAINGR